MKRVFASLCILVACASSHAAPGTQQEIDKLRADCDRTVSAVTRPIYQKYASVLQQMLNRAQQSNDAEAVAILSGELERASLQTQTKESLLALMSGSRWAWYDTTKPAGTTENWAEFYKDGTGVTSWGSSFKYEVVAPASLRVLQPAPPASWFFTINVSKKEANSDISATGQGERRSLKFLRTGPPTNPVRP
jgi:hypothetical protein